MLDISIKGPRRGMSGFGFVDGALLMVDPACTGCSGLGLCVVSYLGMQDLEWKRI